MEPKSAATQDLPSPPPPLSGARWRLFRARAIQAVLLFCLWLVLSGMFDALHLAYGVFSVALVLLLNHRLHLLPLQPGETPTEHPILLHRLFAYLLWLLWQIVQSGLYVAYLVMHPLLPISPCLVRFRSMQPNVQARVILGNSITLTPGTITVEVEGNRFLVHAITREAAEGLFAGDMEYRVARIYLRECRREDACFDAEILSDSPREP